jgi:molybdenum cofactor biosynthesis enzyme MoaA
MPEPVPEAVSDQAAASATDVAATPRGCLMCDSLYVKANGEMPCWDDVGEQLILRRLSWTGVPEGTERDIFASPELVEIRRAFLEGRLPHEGLCTGCAVLGHGRASQLRPSVMNVLHVEPAYLCQLSCPQCLTPRERLGLQEPPYYMSVDFFDGLLRQLQHEGVSTIRLIHFEGRGDPLLNRKLGEMVELARRRYPAAVIMATSHGNFPFAAWMIESGLDVLRLSVDGAYEESYQRYRVGGTLAAPLALMREIRDAKRRTGKLLHVEWKYILFEWNDGDVELVEAARLARECGVRLRFCLTHTDGRSLRIPTPKALRETVERLGLGASLETTFQLREDGSPADASLVLAEHVETLLLEALELFRRGEGDKAEVHLREALRGDPGDPEDPSAVGGATVDELFAAATKHCRFPSTASALANVALELDEPETAEALFRRYFELAGNTSDREEITIKLIDLAVCNRLGCKVHEAADVAVSAVLAAERAALEIDLGPTEGAGALEDRLPSLLERGRPMTLLTLGGIRRVRDDLRTARTLLARYLERLPEDSDVAGEIHRVGEEMKLTYRAKRLVKALLGLPPGARLRRPAA